MTKEKIKISAICEKREMPDGKRAHIFLSEGSLEFMLILMPWPDLFNEKISNYIIGSFCQGEECLDQHILDFYRVKDDAKSEYLPLAEIEVSRKEYYEVIESIKKYQEKSSAYIDRHLSLIPHKVLTDKDREEVKNRIDSDTKIKELKKIKDLEMNDLQKKLGSLGLFYHKKEK
jgi:hypothetical protein